MFSFFKKKKEASISMNILIKKEDGAYIAHCLELDIVAVADTKDDAQREVVSLICTQIDYAFSNDNLENLYHPAPPEVWAEWRACKKQSERQYPLESGFQAVNDNNASSLPAWLIAKTCSENFCHV